MKFIKTYEKIEHNVPKYKIGDYVICDSTNFDYLKYLIDNNIGQIVNIVKARYIEYYIKFPNEEETVMTWEDEILHCSENVEKLELIMKVKKYNL